LFALQTVFVSYGYTQAYTEVQWRGNYFWTGG